MAYGSALPTFKRALIDSLVGYVDNTAYQSPMQPDDMNGADGSRVSCWWDDGATIEIDEAVAVGPGTRWFDEYLTLTLVIQALGKDTTDTQEVCDQRATEVLAEVMALLSSLPAAGAADTATVQIFDATPSTPEYTSGVLGTNLRAASWRVPITVHSRIKLERS